MNFTRIIVLIIATCFFAACKTAAPLDAYKNSDDRQIFERAENNMQKGSYEQASKDFEALDTLYPFGEYSQQGQLGIINAYYKGGDRDSAIAAADRYIRLYPRADNVDYAYYMKGIINKGGKRAWYEKWINAEPASRDVSAQQEAIENFTTLTERFPNSKYTPEALTYMVELRSQIAQHTLEVAQYYLRHKTYIAAANRATQVLQNYPRSSQVAPALDIMIQSYHALNEPDMAEEARQVLQDKFPQYQSSKSKSKKSQK